MIEALKQDMKRYRIGQTSCPYAFAYTIRKLFSTYGLHATAVYRFGRWINTRFHYRVMLPLKFVLNIIYAVTDWMIRKAYGIKLNRYADIGPGLYIGHFGGIEVGPCTIGANCSIAQQVKICSVNDTEMHVRIGSCVWIGAHARIEGCLIEGHATIAAGAYVKRNISSRNLAAGNPARVVLTNYDNTEILDVIL